MPVAAPAAAALRRRQVLIVFSGIMLGMLLAAIDQTIVAISIFGAVFTGRLTHLFGGAVPENLTPAAINQLPLEQRAQTASAFADAITTVFLWAVPLVLVGWMLTWFLKEKILRTSSGHVAREAEIAGNGHGDVVDLMPIAAASNGNGHASTTTNGDVDREPEREHA
jgi:hypothetical protein